MKANHTSGFMLLELLIVLVLIGILGTILMPNLQRLSPRYEQKKFIARLNALVQFSWQQAVTSHMIQKIEFNTEKNYVALHTATNTFDKAGEPLFKPVQKTYIKTSFTWPDQFKIKQFFIEGFNEMARFVDRKTSSIWFFIVPNGLAQDVIINIIDLATIRNNKPQEIGLVLNPFNAQFKQYDTFQKP